MKTLTVILLISFTSLSLSGQVLKLKAEVFCTGGGISESSSGYYHNQATMGEVFMVGCTGDYYRTSMGLLVQEKSCLTVGGIDDNIFLHNSDDILFFPNPTSGTLNVKGESLSEYVFYVYDDLSKLIAVFAGCTSFSLQQYPAGLYLVRYVDSNGKTGVPVKIIKQ